MYRCKTAYEFSIYSDMHKEVWDSVSCLFKQDYALRLETMATLEQQYIKTLMRFDSMKQKKWRDAYLKGFVKGFGIAILIIIVVVFYWYLTTSRSI